MRFRPRRYDMRRESRLRLLLPVAVIVLGLGAACGERIDPGDLTVENHELGLEGAERVTAEIDMAFGKLTVVGCSGDLVDAEFTYNVKDWKPVIKYEVNGDVGDLIVKQPESKGRTFGRGVRNEWHLTFGDDAPLDLTMEVGAAECVMDLDGVPVTRMNLKFGAGNVEVAIGDSRTLREMKVEAGAGDIRVDLRGEWGVDLDARIKAGVGRVVVDLPQETGVRVETSKGIGKVSLSGLWRRGDYYVNDAYGKTDVQLDIKVEAGVGAIELRAGEEEDTGVTI
jgi:hypothetical protein